MNEIPPTCPLPPIFFQTEISFTAFSKKINMQKKLYTKQQQNQGKTTTRIGGRP